MLTSCFYHKVKYLCFRYLPSFCVAVRLNGVTTREEAQKRLKLKNRINESVSFWDGFCEGNTKDEKNNIWLISKTGDWSHTPTIFIRRHSCWLMRSGKTSKEKQCELLWPWAHSRLLVPHQRAFHLPSGQITATKHTRAAGRICVTLQNENTTLPLPFLSSSAPLLLLLISQFPFSSRLLLVRWQEPVKPPTHRRLSLSCFDSDQFTSQHYSRSGWFFNNGVNYMINLVLNAQA